MKKWICLVLIFALLGTVALAEVNIGSEAIHYDLELDPVSDDVFSGNKLTVINVWGTFCGPCIREMPFLGRLAEEYADRGVRFVGIVCDVSNNDQSSLETAKKIVEATGADYLHLVPDEDLWERYCVQSDYIPMSWFLDENGNKLDNLPLVGSMDYDGWKATIERRFEELE